MVRNGATVDALVVCSTATIVPLHIVGVQMVCLYIYISAWASALSRSTMIGQCEGLELWDEQRVQIPTFFCFYAF